MQVVPLADHKAFVRELAELHHAEWSHFNPSLTLEARAEAIAKAAGREGIPSIFIAITGDELIGSAALVQQDMKTRLDLSPWLASVYVKEKFRRQGVASALIDRCESEAARSGVTTWYLYTEFASKLYDNLGWSLMERCEYQGVTVSIMSKGIAS